MCDNKQKPNVSEDFQKTVPPMVNVVLGKNFDFTRFRFMLLERRGNFGRGGGVLPYSLGVGVPLGSRKSYPLLDQILQVL